VLDHFGHGPVEEDGASFGVVPEAVFDLFAGGTVADPDVSFARGAERVAETADDGAHGVPAVDVYGRKFADGFGAALVVIPELNAGAVEKGNEEAVDGRRPLEAAAGQVEFLYDQWMEKAREVGARGHADAWEGFFDGACAADALAALNDEDALAGFREIGSAGETVVSGTDDDDVPGFRGEVADGNGEADFAEDGGGG